MSSVTQLSNHSDKGARGRSQRTLLANAQTDLANLRAAVVAITLKLDSDAGVTDTNYTAACNPVALNLTA